MDENAIANRAYLRHVSSAATFTFLTITQTRLYKADLKNKSLLRVATHEPALLAVINFEPLEQRLATHSPFQQQNVVPGQH
ncbi:MAG: hypothetical protein WA510_19810 [Acidobacteriaceae bacterium]